MLSMPGCHLIACCLIRTKLSIFGWAPASSWTSWNLSPFLLNSLPFSSPLLSGILDQELSFGEHKTALTRSCYYHLRQLRVVSRSLSSSSASTLVHAFRADRLDYCY